jgi:hypothetical protein
MKASEFNSFQQAVNKKEYHLFENILSALDKCSSDKCLSLTAEIAMCSRPEFSAPAADILIASGVKGLEKLFAGFEVKPEETRNRVFSILKLRQEDCRELLFALLDSNDESIYYWVFELLSLINPPDFPEYLRARLYSSVKFKRLCAVRAAGRIKAYCLADDLVMLLDDSFGSVRQEAFASLASMGRKVINRIISGFGEQNSIEYSGHTEFDAKKSIKLLLENISGSESCFPFFNVAEDVVKARRKALLDTLFGSPEILDLLKKTKPGSSGFSLKDAFDFFNTAPADVFVQKARHNNRPDIEKLIPLMTAFKGPASTRALAVIFERTDLPFLHRLACLKELLKRSAHKECFKTVWQLIDQCVLELENAGNAKGPAQVSNIGGDAFLRLAETALISLNNKVSTPDREKIVPLFRHYDFRIRSASRIALER